MRNQCDGCRRGLPVVNGTHKGPTLWSGQGCTKDRYVEGWWESTIQARAKLESLDQSRYSHRAETEGAN